MARIPLAEHRFPSPIAGVSPGFAGVTDTTTALAALAVSADPAVAITCGLCRQLAHVAFIALFAVSQPVAVPLPRQPLQAACR